MNFQLDSAVFGLQLQGIVFPPHGRPGGEEEKKTCARIMRVAPTNAPLIDSSTNTVSEPRRQHGTRVRLIHLPPHSGCWAHMTVTSSGQQAGDRPVSSPKPFAGQEMGSFMPAW
jgi:hypothetical protein